MRLDCALPVPALQGTNIEVILQLQTYFFDCQMHRHPIVQLKGGKKAVIDQL
jgi:hypothetical protein